MEIMASFNTGSVVTSLQTVRIRDEGKTFVLFSTLSGEIGVISMVSSLEVCQKLIHLQELIKKCVLQLSGHRVTEEGPYWIPSYVELIGVIECRVLLTLICAIII